MDETGKAYLHAPLRFPLAMLAKFVAADTAPALMFHYEPAPPGQFVDTMKVWAMFRSEGELVRLDVLSDQMVDEGTLALIPEIVAEFNTDPRAGWKVLIVEALQAAHRDIATAEATLANLREAQRWHYAVAKQYL